MLHAIPRSLLKLALNTFSKERKALIAALAVVAIVVFGVSSVSVLSDSTASLSGADKPVLGERVAAFSASSVQTSALEKLIRGIGGEDRLQAILHHRWGNATLLNTVLAPTVTATKTDALFTDVDGDLQADPGDTLKYTVTINAAGEDATGVTFTDTVDPNTAFVAGSLTATPVAVNDSYAATGNVRISVPAGSGVLANDFLGLPAATITGAPATSVNGGDVAVAADGSFTYNPAPGFEGSDSFTYTLTNSEGSNNATVSITVSGMIWFVNAAASCPCDGRLTNPFVDLTGAGSFDAVAADDPGDNIFMYSGAYTGGLTLLNTQKLIGQGASASLASIAGITSPPFSDPLPATAGARPTVSNAAGSNIILGSGNTLRGFDIGNSDVAGSGISGTAFGTLTVSELAISGTGRALDLDNGTLAATIDSISSSNSTTNGVTLNNVGGSFSVTGATTVTNATQEGISISNITNIGTPSLQFGAVTIASRNATGILLDNVDNSGGTMSFGAVSIPNPNAAGGYGIRVQNSSALVSVASATISDSNMVSAQSDGTADGIPDNDGDGDAIFLINNTGSFTLNGGTLSNCGNDCIDLRDSSALVLSNVNISTPGLDVTSATTAGFGGHGISSINLTGTSSITGGTISGWNVGNRDGLYLINTTSTALTLTVEGTTFQNATGNRGIGIQGRNAANMTVTVGGATNNVATNCTFSNIQSTALQSTAGASAASTATVNLTVQNSTFQNSSAGGKTNLVASVNEAGTSTVVIQDNTFSNVYRTASTGEALINLNSSATLAGNQMGITVQRNNINGVGIAGSIGPLSTILVLLTNAANVPNTINIDDNTLSNVQQQGIFLDMANTGVVASNINSRIVNNCIGKLRVAGACTGANAPIGLGSTIASGIRVERRTAGAKQANVLIDGNTIRNGTAVAGSALNSPGIFARTQIDNTSSVTVTNNDVDTIFTGVAEMRFDTNNASATMCVDVNTNIVAAGAGTIAINETAGALNVEQASAAAVAAANGIPAGNVTVTGTPQFGIACAIPPVASLLRPTRDYLAFRSGVKGMAVPQKNASARKADKVAKLHHADRKAPEIVSESAVNGSAAELGKALTAINSAGALNSAMVADVNLAIGTLPAGESVTITFRVLIDDPFLGSGAEVSNQGTVSGTNFGDVLTDDPTVGGAADPTVTPIDLQADVAVTKTDSPDPVTDGSNITYQITVTNNGPYAAQSLSLSDAVPANTTLVSVTTPVGWTRTDLVPPGGTGTLTFTRASLAASASSIFTVVVNVTAGTPNGTIISNTANVSSANDPVPGNNSAVATTLVQNAADLAISKTVLPTGPNDAGTNVTYTILVTNNGPNAANSVTFTDAVPAGTSVVSQSNPGGWSCNTIPAGNNGTITCTKASMANGETATLTVVASVNCNVADNTVINNTATVSAVSPVDTNTANNTSNASFTVNNDAPVVTATVTQSQLPFNTHELINVGLSASATDGPCGTTTVTVQVFGDEDDQTPTANNEVFSPDAKDLASGTLRLRGERMNSGDGRVYLIVVTSTDAAGQTGFATVTVVVPKSNSPSNVASVMAQAAAAKAFADANNGAPPVGYFVIGDGPIIGNKQ